MRRQGLRQRSYSTLSEASWDKDHDSQEEQRASWWSLRSSYIPHSESRGEAHQSPQALQAGGDPIRETSGELRGDAKDSSDQDLVMICKQALVAVPESRHGLRTRRFRCSQLTYKLR